MRAEIRIGAVRGIIIAAYALLGYLFAYVAMGGRVL